MQPVRDWGKHGDPWSRWPAEQYLEHGPHHTWLVNLGGTLEGMWWGASWVLKVVHRQEPEQDRRMQLFLKNCVPRVWESFTKSERHQRKRWTDPGLHEVNLLRAYTEAREDLLAPRQEWISFVHANTLVPRISCYLTLKVSFPRPQFLAFRVWLEISMASSWCSIIEQHFIFSLIWERVMSSHWIAQARVKLAAVLP